MEHIIIDPKILSGKPIIRGTRLAVEFIVDLLAQGWSFELIEDNYPGIHREHILACLEYAHQVLNQERIYPIPATV